MNIFDIIKILGGLGYIFLVLTVISGFLRLKLKYHKLFAILAISFSTLHLMLIFLR